MSSQKNISYRSLGVLKSVVETTGHRVTHAYEDLVFIEHNAFLLRMEACAQDVSLIFNEQSEAEARAAIAQSFAEEGKKQGLDIRTAGTYCLQADEATETIELRFMTDA